MNQPQSLSKRSPIGLSILTHRKPLALAVMAATITGCGSDNNSSSLTIEPEPAFSISDPGLTVDTLESSLTVNATILAQDIRLGTLALDDDLLVNSIEIRRGQSVVDESGNVQDLSGNTFSLADIPFDPAKGGGENEDDNYFETELVDEVNIGRNILTFTANYGEDQSIDRIASVVRGSSWMKEAAIQYDASGNLYTLDQVYDDEEFDVIGNSIRRIDPGTGEKILVNDLGVIESPVDFLVRGSSAYVLDSVAGIYPIPSFDEGTAPGPVMACAAVDPFVDETFKDAVAFDAKFDASGNPVMFYVADRGRKEIVLIEAGGDCSILPTPEQTVDDPTSDDDSDTLEVPGLLFNLPIDIVYYHDTATATDSLFASGGWVGFGSFSENTLDASGNPILDASGNPLETAVTRSLAFDGSQMVRINLDEPDELEEGERLAIGFRAEQALDESGNPATDSSGNPLLESTLFFLDSPGSMVVKGDDILVFDRNANGILALDVNSEDEEGTYLVRPVSGSAFLTSSFPLTVGSNPDQRIPFLNESSMVLKDSNTLTVMSMDLGSYIDVDLTPVSLPGDEECAVLQCEFTATRTIWPGGATIKVNDSEENQDAGYEISSRAVASRHFSNFQSVSAFGDSFLSFDRNTGQPSVDFTSIAVVADENNRIDESLVSDGRAIAVANDPATYYLVDLPEDRLVSYTVSGGSELSARSVVSGKGITPAFSDPLSAFIWRPFLRNDSDPDSPVVDSSLSNSYYMLDRGESDLIRVTLEPGEYALTEESTGDREELEITGCADLGAATSISFVSSLGVDSYPIDLNGDGDSEDSFMDESGDTVEEGADIFYYDYASVFVASGQNLLEIDMLTNTCEVLSENVFDTGAEIVGLDIQFDEQITETEDSEAIEVIQRDISIMALDAANMEFVEIQCRQPFDDSGNSLALNCEPTPEYPTTVYFHDMTLNEPLSPVALRFNWASRQALIFDNKVNSIFSVDIAPRNEAGGPVAVEDLTAGFSGQTVITDRGLTFNCDPKDDSAGCKNL